MTVTDNDLHLFNTINRQVNRDIQPMTDMAQYGVAEFWVHEPASGRGDCEDYALTKFKRLIERGIPRRRMAIWVVLANPNGYWEGHAILVIDNDLVLDNLSKDIKHFRNTNYKYLRAFE